MLLSQMRTCSTLSWMCYKDTEQREWDTATWCTRIKYRWEDTTKNPLTATATGGASGSWEGAEAYTEATLSLFLYLLCMFNYKKQNKTKQRTLSGNRSRLYSPLSYPRQRRPETPPPPPPAEIGWPVATQNLQHVAWRWFKVSSVPGGGGVGGACQEF